MSLAAGLAVGLDLIIEGLPVPGQHISAADDNINFFGPGPHRCLDFREACFQRGQPGGKACGHRRHRNAAAFQGIHGSFNHLMINTDRASSEFVMAKAQGFQNIGTYRISCLGTEPPHPARRVIPGQGGQVNAGNRLEQPCGLPLFFYRTPSAEGGNTPVHCRFVDFNLINPAGVKVTARYPWKAVGQNLLLLFCHCLCFFLQK